MLLLHSFQAELFVIYGIKGLGGQACALNERSLYANYQVFACPCNGHVLSSHWLFWWRYFCHFVKIKNSVSNSPVFFEEKNSPNFFL